MKIIDEVIMSFFFNDTATTEIYTLSLHDALPISTGRDRRGTVSKRTPYAWRKMRRQSDEDERGIRRVFRRRQWVRSEEHTSELQSRQYLVCRLLLEKKKNNKIHFYLYFTSLYSIT